jgi:Sigma 54 modulation protein / S30EA ribosomal protein
MISLSFLLLVVPVTVLLLPESNAYIAGRTTRRPNTASNARSLLFVTPPPPLRSWGSTRRWATVDSSAASSPPSLPIIINGQNIPLTDALVDHVNKRIGNTLSKLIKNGAVRECDVHLSVSKNPKVRVLNCV